MAQLGFKVRVCACVILQSKKKGEGVSSAPVSSTWMAGVRDHSQWWISLATSSHTALSIIHYLTWPHGLLWSCCNGKNNSLYFWANYSQYSKCTKLHWLIICKWSISTNSKALINTLQWPEGNRLCNQSFDSLTDCLMMDDGFKLQLNTKMLCFKR